MNAVFVLGLLVAIGWSQADSSKPTTYTLEPLNTSNAVYPSEARGRKIQGRVIAMMLVSESGDVENVQVFKADPLLSQTVEDTVRQWKFKPVMKNGQAVPVGARVTFDFNLAEQTVTPEVSPATEFPQYVRVSDTVMQGLILSTPKPIYPQGAKANHVRGTVKLAMVIGKDGKVTDVQVVSGPAELAQAAVDAVRQWRYRPYRLLGRPVEIQTTTEINFR